jgi:hypothetical protein
VRSALVVVAAATVVAVAAGCGGGSGEKAVAHVGATTVTREQLDQTVEHFQEEATREGKPFSVDAAARKHLLGLLVYRARLQEGAAALGVTVPDEAVEQRIQAAGADDAEEKDARAFTESSVRAQLLVEAVYKKLSRGVRAQDPQQAQAQRNAALNRWLASLAKHYPVR